MHVRVCAHCVGQAGCEAGVRRPSRGGAGGQGGQGQEARPTRARARARANTRARTCTRTRALVTYSLLTTYPPTYYVYHLTRRCTTPTTAGYHPSTPPSSQRRRPRLSRAGRTRWISPLAPTPTPTHLGRRVGGYGVRFLLLLLVVFLLYCGLGVAYRPGSG